jgi:quinol monooxygenase YgiN
MIHVIALVTAKPGRREDILREFAWVLPVIRAEKGCIEFVPVVDVEDAGAPYAPLGSDAFAVVEKWETLADLRAHGASPHMAAYGAKVKDMIAARSVHVASAV